MLACSCLKSFSSALVLQNLRLFVTFGLYVCRFPANPEKAETESLSWGDPVHLFCSYACNQLLV